MSIHIIIAVEVHPVVGIVFLVGFNPADFSPQLGVGRRFVEEVDPQKDLELVRFHFPKKKTILQLIESIVNV
jgi:hypothetical protein